MKKSMKITLLAVMIALVAIFAVSCGEKEEFTAISTPSLEYKDGAYTVNVSSDVTKFDLASLFSISEQAYYVVSKTESFETTINQEVLLEEGKNEFYVKVIDSNKFEKTYKFVVIRSKQCVVTFNTNGGTEIPQIFCEEGRVLEAPVSIKLGYSLKWDYDFKNPITEDVTINAEWTPNTYKITIDGADKAIDTVFNTVPQLTADEKNGYKFVEWQYNGAKFDVSKPYSIDKDIVLTPVYEAIKYTITYVEIRGTNTNPITYTVEDEIVLKPLTWTAGEDDRIIFEFEGWYQDAELTQKVEKLSKGTIGSVVLYANWTVTELPPEPIVTTVTFVAEGYEFENIDATVGNEYNFPKLEKEGYIFAGWQSEDGKLLVQINGVWAFEGETVTLIPNWTKKAYSITYMLNGGSNNSENVDSFFITDTVVLLNPTKQYSEFAGWYLDENFENEIVEISEGTSADLILYAKWNEITCTVNYDVDGGEITQTSQTVVLGSNYTLIIPTKLGYTFNGWYNVDALVDSKGVWTLDGDVTLKAQWSLETYSIDCELDGGTVEDWVDNYTILSANIKLPKPTKEGKDFLGWSIDNGPIVKDVIVTKGSVGNRVYIAHWSDSKAENGVLYSITNGVAIVVGYEGTVGANVTIPSEYNGYKVVAIDNNAFSGYGKKLETLSSSSSSFTTLMIPKTITRIGANAFTECDDLKVQVSDLDVNDEQEVSAWIENITIEVGNDHVLDVILGKRPAIGWRVYYKP